MSEIPTKFVGTHSPTDIVLTNEDLHVSKFSSSSDWVNLLTNFPIPRSRRYYYFEISIRQIPDGNILIGVAPEGMQLRGSYPGARENQGYALYLINGTLFGGSGIKIYTGFPVIKQGDVVGCALDVQKGSCFFTLNGNALGDAFINMKLSERMHPVVTLYKQGQTIEANFGKQPFLYQDENFTNCVPSYPINEGRFADQWATKVQKAPSNPNRRFCDYLTDVTLVSKDGEEFRCHRVILSVRSDVFKAMFEPEKHTGEIVNISEYDGETLRKMVDFIYTDEIDGYESEIDMDLFAIAHKYQLDRLRNLCLKKLSKEITEDNVLKVWMVADLYQEKQLETHCEKFINENWAKVKRSLSFAEMKGNNKDHLIQLLTNLKKD